MPIGCRKLLEPMQLWFQLKYETIEQRGKTKQQDNNLMAASPGLAKPRNFLNGGFTTLKINKVWKGKWIIHFRRKLFVLISHIYMILFLFVLVYQSQCELWSYISHFLLPDSQPVAGTIVRSVVIGRYVICHVLMLIESFWRNWFLRFPRQGTWQNKERCYNNSFSREIVAAKHRTLWWNP